MTDLYVVRCSESLRDGSPCMTLYPAPTPTYYGPCPHCWTRKHNPEARSSFFDELIPLDPIEDENE